MISVEKLEILLEVRRRHYSYLTISMDRIVRASNDHDFDKVRRITGEVEEENTSIKKELKKIEE